MRRRKFNGGELSGGAVVGGGDEEAPALGREDKEEDGSDSLML
jgi:hypothetical protein